MRTTNIKELKEINNNRLLLGENKLFLSECKSCKKMFGTDEKMVTTCSEICDLKLAEEIRKIGQAMKEIEQNEFALYQDKVIEFGEKRANIYMTTFTAENVAKGETKFLYALKFDSDTLWFKGVSPLKKKNDISLLNDILKNNL